jgi:hypothetical protein
MKFGTTYQKKEEEEQQDANGPHESNKNKKKMSIRGQGMAVIVKRNIRKI